MVMRNENSQRYYLLTTMFLIVLIGAPAVYSMIQEPPLAMLKTGGRAPASAAMRIPIEAEVVRRNSIKAKSVTMDFECNKKTWAKETDGNLVRLKADACMNSQWKQVSVVNKTNGFTASVIFVKDGFTTDFIDLSQGENVLAVSGINEKGRKVEHLLTITRRAPASL